jgi:hypothetical protein
MLRARTWRADTRAHLALKPLLLLGEALGDRLKRKVPVRIPEQTNTQARSEAERRKLSTL